ncbi:hypothetical protein [Stieleria neptunia]
MPTLDILTLKFLALDFLAVSDQLPETGRTDRLDALGLQAFALDDHIRTGRQSLQFSDHFRLFHRPGFGSGQQFGDFFTSRSKAFDLADSFDATWHRELQKVSGGKKCSNVFGGAAKFSQFSARRVVRFDVGQAFSLSGGSGFDRLRPRCQALAGNARTVWLGHTRFPSRGGAVNDFLAAGRERAVD